MTEYDAFSGGIVPGGLRNRSEIRIMICYLLCSVERPMTREQITEAIEGEQLANYFEVNSAISELVGNGAITVTKTSDGEQYTVSDSGKNAAENLETTLPRTVRDKAVAAAVHLLARSSMNRNTEVTEEKLETGGYNVTFILRDGEQELMSLRMYVADALQLEKLKSKFLDSPLMLYSGIIELLN
ncbi:MAG: DUF4364 family protein [Clostridiales bacterium]|nr:DUF4364 family protein [Clostridiales bacterium]